MNENYAIDYYRRTIAKINYKNEKNKLNYAIFIFNYQ